MRDKLFSFLQVWFADHINKAFVLLSCAIVVYTLLTQSTTSATEENPHDVFTADTVIPEGYVLVPIEIQNQNSMETLVGDYAVVDLFTVATPLQKGGVRVGNRLKMLRAPLKPNEFAVLVPEKETETVMQWPGPFMAVIQNPQQQNPAQVIAPTSKRKSRITYQKGVRP